MKKKTIIPSGENVVLNAKAKLQVSQIEFIYRFAFGLRKAAKIMANSSCAAKENSHEIMAFVTGAIVLSYSFLEAALNEFISLNATAPNSPLGEKCKAVITAINSEDLRPQENKNTLQMFNVILRILGKQELDEGNKIYQNADLVRILRNNLIHPMPNKIVIYPESTKNHMSEQKMVKKLRSHLGLAVNANFPSDVLTSKCAKWSVCSCDNFFKEFTKRSGVDPGFLVE